MSRILTTVLRWLAVVLILRVLAAILADDSAGGAYDDRFVEIADANPGVARRF